MDRSITNSSDAMTNYPRSNKKKKLTIAASKQGIETAEIALMRLGFNSKTNFAESQLLARNTVTKFFNQQKIQLDIFKKICECLTLNWMKIANLENEESRVSKMNDRSCSEMNEEVMPVQPSLSSERRQVTVMDEPNQAIKLEIILKGDVNSVDNLKIIEFILQEHSGKTIKITDVKEGSIRLTVEGSQEDIELLLFKLKSGEIEEINGFPVENFEILSECMGGEDNDEADDSDRPPKIIEKTIEIEPAMSGIFTDEQIARLSQEIDAQLQELIGSKSREILHKDPSLFPVSGLFDELPEKQSQAIEKVTQEKPKSFLKKFGKAAKNDLCDEDGLLNQQWKKWGDLTNQDVLDKFGVVLVAMGFTGAAVEILAVSLGVIVIHLSVKTFCEEYGEKSEDG